MIRADESGRKGWRCRLDQAARLGFALLLLAACLHPPSIGFGVLMCVLLFLLIMRHDGGIHRLLGLMRLLPWLLVPVVALHALFSPGEIWWSFAGLHLTREGTMTGVALGLHLLLFFLAGMMIARLWPAAAWLHGVQRIPGLGARLYPYLRVLEPLRADIARELRGLWRAQHSWRALPVLLESAVRRALALGRHHAEQLWLHWEVAPARRAPKTAASPADRALWLLLASVWVVGSWH